MIDWLSVAFHAVWALGLAVVLAAVSYRSWWVREVRLAGQPASQRPVIQPIVSGGLLLFCVGMAGLSQDWWQILIWLGLALLFGLDGWRVWRHGRAV